MRLFTLPRVLVMVLAAALLVALGPVAGGAPAKAGAADDLDSKASYKCQYSGLESAIRTPPGLGLGLPSLGFDLPSLGGSDTVSVSSVVHAPASVAPGEDLKLSGESTFTFGTLATAANLSTVFKFLSDDFGVDIRVGSYQRLVRIADLTTTQSTLGSHVVKASWTLPDILVPSSASGQVALSLPHDAVVTNPVTTSPKTVAFTGTLRTDSFLQPNREVACALAADQDASIGAVKVVAAATDEESPSAGSTAPPVPPAAVGAPALGVPAGAPAPAAGVPAPVAVAPTTTHQLAADPIPPATVPGGLRLPPWALLLFGAFVGGGFVLAATSYWRLRLLAAAAAVLALLVVPSPLNPQPSAQAASSRAQVTLICVYNDTNAAADARARDQPTGLSISLDVPASVTPGEVIQLTGSATVQAPEDIRSQAAQLGFTQLDAISDTLSVGLTVGATPRRVFTADRWQTGKTNFGNPLVVSAPLYFPSYRVPADASGAIKLELPRNEVLNRRPPPHSNPHTPPRTALEFVATVSGNGARATYLVDCWRTDKGSGLIATIPVRKAAAAGGGTVPSSGTGGGAVAAPSGGPAAVPVPGGTATAAAPTGAPTASAVPGSTGATPAASAPLLTGAPAGATPQGSGDASVPAWLLITLGALAVVGYGIAVRNHLRLRSARREAASIS